ncbi:hypothetical protein HK101_004325, partial [Irineochytrium annulatum]
ELRNSLRVAKVTCNAELERIIAELNEGVELGLAGYQLDTPGDMPNTPVGGYFAIDPGKASSSL